MDTDKFGNNFFGFVPLLFMETLMSVTKYVTNIDDNYLYKRC